jgi:hypothetical protein
LRSEEDDAAAAEDVVAFSEDGVDADRRPDEAAKEILRVGTGEVNAEEPVSSLEFCIAIAGTDDEAVAVDGRRREIMLDLRSVPC